MLRAPILMCALALCACARSEPVADTRVTVLNATRDHRDASGPVAVTQNPVRMSTMPLMMAAAPRAASPMSVGIRILPNP